MTKQQQAKADKLIVIARYVHKTDRKPNGNVSYLVENGGGKRYCVTLSANGNTACVHHEPEKKLDIPESCESSKGNRKCYHIKACQKLEEARGWQIPAGKSLVRDDYRAEENEAAHVGLVEAPNGNLLTPEELANVPGATTERETALAAARAASEAELAKIEQETLAQIEREEAAAPVGKSEQARLADLPFSEDEKKYRRWTEQEMLTAPLNGSRAFNLLRR